MLTLSSSASPPSYMDSPAFAENDELPLVTRTNLDDTNFFEVSWVWRSVGVWRDPLFGELPEDVWWSR